MPWDQYKEDIARHIHPEGLPPGKRYRNVGKYWDKDIRAWRYTFELEDIPMSSSSGSRPGAKRPNAPTSYSSKAKAKAQPYASRWQQEMVSHLKKVRKAGEDAKRPSASRAKPRRELTGTKSTTKSKEGVTTGQQWRKYGTLTLKLAPSEIKKIKRTLGI